MTDRIKRKRGLGGTNYDPEKKRAVQVKGGQSSPSNFKNDPSRAREMALKSWEVRRAKDEN
jgi:general stress protein YciG